MDYKIYCGGEFIETNQKLNVVNPFSSEIYGNTYLAGEKELLIAIKKAKAVEEELKNLSSFQRYEILMDIASGLEKGKQRIAEIISIEAGKPIKYSKAEVERGIQVFKVAAEESKRLPKEYISLDWTANAKNKEGIIKYFPIGLIAGISPFNFPLNLPSHKIAPGIAAGCPIILKPASKTPLSILELAKIIDNTSLPKGAISILPMDRQSGNSIVINEEFKLLTFTGSAEVGWKMKKDSGKKKVVLELGGNASAIITDTADIDVAVNKCIIGGYAYSGQVCIHLQRIYVKENIFEEFTNKLTKQIGKLKYGNPLSNDTDISVMIDEDNAKRVENWVNEAVSEGAKILTGGKRNGLYYEATLLTNTNPKMKVNAEEVFGPVVIIESYKEFQEAIDMVNNSKFGLQAGVFTKNQDEIEIAFQKLEVGGLMVNDTPIFRVDHMPYGGIKDSGLGREGVKYAIMDMLEPKILVK